MPRLLNPLFEQIFEYCGFDTYSESLILSDIVFFCQFDALKYFNTILNRACIHNMKLIDDNDKHENKDDSDCNVCFYTSEKNFNLTKQILHDYFITKLQFPNDVFVNVLMNQHLGLDKHSNYCNLNEKLFSKIDSITKQMTDIKSNLDSYDDKYDKNQNKMENKRCKLKIQFIHRLDYTTYIFAENGKNTKVLDIWKSIIDVTSSDILITETWISSTGTGRSNIEGAR